MAPTIHIKAVVATVPNVPQIYNASELMSACFCTFEEQLGALSLMFPDLPLSYSHPLSLLLLFWEAKFLFVCTPSTLTTFGGTETGMFSIFFTYFISFKLLCYF